MTPTTTTPHPLYRAQFRRRGSSRWETFAERPSESAAWDEVLVAQLKGADLRVIEVTREHEGIRR